MGIRYALREFRDHGFDPHWMRQRFLTHVVSRYYEARSFDTTPIHQEEWDNLVVLDACRFDLFEEAITEYPLPGDLSKRRSLGSGTPGFLAKNFTKETFHDIVYVTSNPYVNTKLPDDTFHDVVPVWKDGWNDELQTVTPATMRERTLETAEKYPNKRIISHFVQPHVPFIGETQLGTRNESAIRNKALGKETPTPKDRAPSPFELLERGDVSKDRVWEAYRSNLERALPAVKELLSTLDGLTAVTSDHGNALGEFATPFPIRVYGHPLGILIPALTDVPWHVYQNGTRRTIVEEAPSTAVNSVDEDTSERLRMLGYRD